MQFVACNIPKVELDFSSSSNFVILCATNCIVTPPKILLHAMLCATVARKVTPCVQAYRLIATLQLFAN